MGKGVKSAFSPPPLLPRLWFPRITGGPGAGELSRFEVKGLKSPHLTVSRSPSADSILWAGVQMPNVPWDAATASEKALWEPPKDLSQGHQTDGALGALSLGWEESRLSPLSHPPPLHCPSHSAQGINSP